MYLQSKGFPVNGVLISANVVILEKRNHKTQISLLTSLSFLVVHLRRDQVLIYFTSNLL